MTWSPEQHEAMLQDLEQKRQDMVARGELDPRVAEAMRQMDRFEYQDENGEDLTLIRSNLRLTPLERVRRGDQHLRDALRLRGLFSERAHQRTAV